MILDLCVTGFVIVALAVVAFVVVVVEYIIHAL